MKHKDGTAVTDTAGNAVVLDALSYSGQWMGETSVTVTVKSAYPVKFSIGDYIEYRGERFEVNYDPGKIKVSSAGSYGEAFKYESVKLNSLKDELVRCEFFDIVLNDNNEHYTTLPKFNFYVSCLDDLLDRIQANLDEVYGKGLWKIYSRNRSRSVTDRGCDGDTWNDIYGEGTADTEIDAKSITVDNKTCWEALALVNSEWDINFVVRGREIYVDTVGTTTSAFKYGKGNGLYEIEQNADDSQAVITRLRAYGSSTNLPTRYYTSSVFTCFATVSGCNIYTILGKRQMRFITDIPITGYTWFSISMSGNGSGMRTYNVKIKAGDYKVAALVYTYPTEGAEYCEMTVTQSDAQDAATIDAFYEAVKATNKVYFASGINKENFDAAHKDVKAELPATLAIDRLMLPGFPTKTLSEWWNEQTDAKKAELNPNGGEHIFSGTALRPYIDALSIEDIGVRSSSVFFDTDDKKNGIEEIYPTIEDMTVDGVAIDEIGEAEAVTDNGVFKDGQTVPAARVWLKSEVNFDINDLKDTDFKICMKTGMCAGREFSVTGSVKENGRWKLTLQREKDDALDLWFPYKDYNIADGDKFVLTGIELPDSYVEAASEKLLKYALLYLDKNCKTRYTYTPKVDEIYMARQHDEAVADATGATKSLHDTLKEGDVMVMQDEDLGLDVAMTIDSLSITENSDKIPTYEITLKETQDVGSIQKMQAQIDTLATYNTAGTTVAQAKNIVKSEGSKYFLSKMDNDAAAGLIRFLSGIGFGESSDFGISAHGAAILQSLASAAFDADTQTGFGIVDRGDGKYRMSITDLLVWGQAVFHQLEIRKLSYIGGNAVLSGAGSTIVKTEEVTSGTDVTGYKCWLLADDGTTATQNAWEVGDQARCQTFNIKAGSYTDVKNRSYWRLVTEKSTDDEVLTDDDGNVLYDGRKFCWIILSATDCEAGSDAPAEGDVIVLDGNRNTDGTSASRQNVLMLESSGDDAPRIASYRGVSQYTHAGKTVFSLSAAGFEVNSQYFKLTSPSGSLVQLKTYRGTWARGMTYYYYDEVDYGGEIWLCVTASTSGVTSKPAEGSDWHREVTKGTDGTSVTIKGSLENTSQLPTSGNANGDCYIIDGNLWIYTGSTASGAVNGFVNVGQIKGDKGDKGNDGSDGIAITVTPATIVHKKQSTRVTYKVAVKVYEGGTALAYNTDGETDRTFYVGRPEGTLPTGLGWGFTTSDTEFDHVFGVKADATPSFDTTFTVTVVRDGEQETYTMNYSIKTVSDGEQGDKGDDAIEIVATPSSLVFDSGSDGLVSAATLAAKSVQLSITQGGAAYTGTTTYAIDTEKTVNCSASVTSGGLVRITDITKQTVSGNTLSNQSGTAAVTVTLGTGEVRKVFVPWTANVVKYVGQLYADNKTFNSTLTEMKGTVSSQGVSIEKMQSSIAQNASAISLRVTKDDLLTAGIDIENEKVSVTANQFEVKNADGTVTASVNADGRLEVGSGLFKGFVMKEITDITPDNIEDLVKTSSGGYMELDYTKTGSFVRFSGDIKTKYGDTYPVVVLPSTAVAASLKKGLGECLKYIGQWFVVSNNTSDNATIMVQGGGTITTASSAAMYNYIEKGKYAVLKCELTYTKGVLGVVWNGWIGTAG